MREPAQDCCLGKGAMPTRRSRHSRGAPQERGGAAAAVAAGEEAAMQHRMPEARPLRTPPPPVTPHPTTHTRTTLPHPTPPYPTHAQTLTSASTSAATVRRPLGSRSSWRRLRERSSSWKATVNTLKETSLHRRVGSGWAGSRGGGYGCRACCGGGSSSRSRAFQAARRIQQAHHPGSHPLYSGSMEGTRTTAGTSRALWTACGGPTCSTCIDVLGV